MCTQPVECLPGCPGVLCASCEVFVSTDVKVLTGLASRFSSLSLHISKQAAFAVMLVGSVLLMKLFRDFRRGTTPVLRRGIGCLVPIIGDRRLAGLVRVGGGSCPSGSC